MTDIAGAALLPRDGLHTKAAAPIPLERVDVRARITDSTARIVMVQRYRNRERTPIEAVYVFPLPDGAAVCGFATTVAGVTYVGEVLDRDAAFARYDDAMQDGHGAFLLDEERADVFTASVGNVPPGGEVELTLTYVIELEREGDALRFSLPTTVAPRYAPASDRGGAGRSDAEMLNPPVDLQVPYGLSLDITLQMSGAITRLESPSHALTLEVYGASGRVSLAQRDVALDRDVVVIVGAEGLSSPRLVVERDEQGRCAASVTFLPEFAVAQGPAEVVFLVDRSGSMEGTSIAEVRNALQLCLRSMRAGCCFDIVSFGERQHRLFGTSRPYDEAALVEATEYVAGMGASFGGTELAPALQAVLGAPPVAGLRRQVVVLTDGEVTNTDEVIALARRHSDTARVFAFGIGYGASEHLVRGLARAGNGVAEFIAPGERIEAKVMRQVSRLLSPVLDDIRVDWGGLDAVQAPSVLPPLFVDAPLRLFARVETVKPATVTLSARGPAGPLQWRLPFDPAAIGDGTTIGPLAAWARIRELEESDEWSAARGSAQARARRRAAGVTEEIARLAIAYGLVSRETSFVAIEQRATPEQGEVKLRRIPVALTHGWGAIEAHGLPQFVRAGSALLTQRLRGRTPSARFDIDGSTSDMGEDLSMLRATPPSPRGIGKSLSQRLRPWAGDEHLPSPESLGLLRRPLDLLVSLQRADGCWRLTPELLEALGLEPGRITPVERLLRGGEPAPSALATALALLWLRERAAGSAGEWRMLARKAEDWLRAVPPPAAGGDWLAVAEEVSRH